MKRLKFIIICVFMIFSITVYSENWVGRVMTSMKMEGSKTASGEEYDGSAYTAACNAFKFGAEVFVLNIKNKNKAIKVKINDRIEGNKDYFIILTPAASKDIGINNSTELVVVKADFSDINSNEILSIKGLVHEGEIDEEIRKKFPNINWDDLFNEQNEDKNKDKSEDKNKDKDIELKGYPETEKNKFFPIKKELFSFLDLDEILDYKYSTQEKENKENPLLEKKKKPFLSKNINAIDFDDEILLYKFKEKTENKDLIIKDKKVFPKKIKTSFLLDEFSDDYQREKKVEKNDKIEKFPDKEKYKNPKLENEKKILDEDNFEKYKFIKKEKDIQQIEQIQWFDKLEKDKIYIRFSTSLDKEEGERRYILFKQIFIEIIGIKKNGKYILYIGPMKETEIDKNFKLIKKFGYKDAFIIKGR